MINPAKISIEQSDISRLPFNPYAGMQVPIVNVVAIPLSGVSSLVMSHKNACCPSRP